MAIVYIKDYFYRLFVMEKKDNKKIISIQVSRSIAALFVMLYHIRLFENTFGDGKHILPSFLKFGYIGVDFFFVISGFVMATITRGRFKQNAYIKQFLFSRASRIYPIYWFYTIILIIAYMVCNTDISQYTIDITTFLLLPRNHQPILNVAWTLRYEVYFYFIFSFFLFLPENKLFKLLLGWLFSIIILNLFINSMNIIVINPFFKLITSPYSIEFIFGCFISKIVYGYRTSFNGKLISFSGFLILLICSAIYSYVGLTIWNRVLLIGLPFSLLLLGLVLIEINDKIVFFRSLSSIGDSSYSIYLSHCIILLIINKIWLLFDRPPIGIIGNLFVVLTMIVSVLVFGSYSYRYIEKPMMIFCKNYCFKSSFRRSP